jgi:hypothetical protein
MEILMESDNYNISTITSDTFNISTSSDSSYCNISDYIVDTIDISNLAGITLTPPDYTTPDYKTRRLDVRNNGNIPIDIWATLYNNGVIDD